MSPLDLVRELGALGPPDGYRYSLPAGWVHLDLEPSRITGSIRSAVRLRIRRQPRLAPYLVQLDRLLRAECDVAAAGGAERLSLLAEPIGSCVVTAAATFVVSPAPATPDRPTSPAGRTDSSWRRWVDSSGPADRLLLQRLLPWPGLERLGVMTMTSTCRPVWGLVETTFVAAAESFQWTWSDATEGAGTTTPGGWALAAAASTLRGDDEWSSNGLVPGPARGEG